MAWCTGPGASGRKTSPEVWQLSLGQLSTLNASIAWMNRRYEPYWGDWEELQLDALHYAAEDMREHVVSPIRYIVLISDSPFHSGTGGSLVTKAHVLDDLEDPTGALCRVFISLYDTADWFPPHRMLQDLYYFDLDANSGQFDPADYSVGADPLYPLTGLRTDILSRFGL